MGVDKLVKSVGKRLKRYFQRRTKKNKPEEIQCPVCGYYCLGRGGFGCIDKPGFLSNGFKIKAPSSPVSDKKIIQKNILGHLGHIKRGKNELLE